MREVHKTESVCRQCNKVIPALIYEHDNQIFFKKQCAVHGPKSTLISSDAQWYFRTNKSQPVLRSPKTHTSSTEKCPFECGFCNSHQQLMFMPVVAITSACNLNCPICYTFNNNRQPFFMSKAEFSQILARIREHDSALQIINFTGGEPTLHPQFPELVEMCHDAGIHRITISTNGLRFIKEPDLLKRLADLDARIVLSFNSFRDGPYDIMSAPGLLAKKMKVLELLEEVKPSTSLLAVVATGINDHEIGDITKFVMSQEHMVSLEIHTITFTGHTSTQFDRTARITTPDVLKNICSKNQNIKIDDFMPSPCAHQMCYSTCYLLKLNDGWIPYNSFIPKDEMKRLLSNNLYIESGRETEAILSNAVNELWAKNNPTPGDEQILKSLRAMLKRMFPAKDISYSERQKISEKSNKTIYLHSHMDEDNFDLERIKQCCVAVPSADGAVIPTCSYNNFYRAEDKRFRE